MLLNKLLLLFSFLLLGVSFAGAQRSYQKFVVQLRNVCSDSVFIDNVKHDIPLLESFLQMNPNSYKAWYELSKQYYEAATVVDSDSMTLKSIYCLERYSETAPRTFKWLGHWNAAVFWHWKKDCTCALQELNLAKSLVSGKHRRSWHGATEDLIRNSCNSAK